MPAHEAGFLAFAPELSAAEKGFDEALFAALTDIEEQHFWFRSRNELISAMLRKHAPTLTTFMEIGCGTGYVLRRVRAEFPEASLTGSEIFSEGLRFAQRRVPSASFYQMDARAIPFRDAFDAIGAFDVLEHIREDRTVVAQVREALAPGGHFVATVPQHKALWSRQDVHAHHVRRYSRGRLMRILRGAGLEIVELTSFVSLLLPAMMLARLRLDTRTEAIEGVETLRVPDAVNTVSDVAMRIERAFIRLGVSFPAGGSLIVVARRPSAAETL